MLKPSKGQRVAVFVDHQNLYYTARYNHHGHVNYESLLKRAVNGRILTRALTYVIRTEEINKEAFFEALGNIGFEVKAKDLQVFSGGAKKGDWDVGLAIDAVQVAHKVDTIVIASGDGDYIPLVEHLQQALGCRVECISFGSSTSAKLIESVDEFIDMDKSSTFILKRKEREDNGQERTIQQPLSRHAPQPTTHSSPTTTQPSQTLKTRTRTPHYGYRTQR